MFSVVTGTLLAGPIGTGNLYLTKVEANGVPSPPPFCVSSDEGSGSRAGVGCGAALLGNGNGNTPRRDSLSSGAYLNDWLNAPGLVFETTMMV